MTRERESEGCEDGKDVQRIEERQKVERRIRESSRNHRDDCVYIFT